MQSFLRAEKKPIDLFYISDNIWSVYFTSTFA